MTKRKAIYSAMFIGVSTAAPFSLLSCTSENQVYSPVIVKNFSKKINENILKGIEYNIFHGGVYNSHLIDDLNGIIITDEIYAGIDVGGAYFPESKEIVINTKELDVNNITGEGNIIEYITELIAHEYNHYLTYDYINNINPSSSIRTSDIYNDVDGQRKPEVWNKNFVTKFKELLNYDKPSTKYSANEIEPGYVSVGSLYDAKELFDIANGNAVPSLPQLANKKAVMAPFNHEVKDLSKYIIKEDSLAYLFSLQELVARKLQVVRYDYSIMKNQSGSDFGDNGWININKNIWTPYLEDILNYQGAFNSSDVYLADKPTNQLKDLMDEYLTQNKNISFMKYDNNKHINKQGKIEGQVDYTKVYFGGSIESKEDIKIGYIDNGKFFNLDYDFSKVGDTTHYITVPTDIGILANKKLVYKEGNKIVDLTIKDENHGGVTTFDYNNDVSKQNYKIDPSGTVINI